MAFGRAKRLFLLPAARMTAICALHAQGVAHARCHLLEEERFVSAGDGHERLLGCRMRRASYKPP